METIQEYKILNKNFIPQPIPSLDGIQNVTNQMSTQSIVDNLNALASHRYYKSLPFIPTKRLINSKLGESTSFNFDPNAIRKTWIIPSNYY